MPILQTFHSRSLLVLALLCGALGLHAQAPLHTGGVFPDKNMKWIVGYPAGGGSDFLARTVAAQLSTQLGAAVVIDNRPGAGAIIGADAAAHAPADGYTVFTADNGVLIYNPVLYKQLPYNPVTDFAPLGLMARTPLVVVAAVNANIRSGKDLIDKLQRNPGLFSYGSPGNGSPHHLAMELLKSQIGAFVVHIPYRGAAPALQDLMGGQIPLMMVDTSTGMAAVKSGKALPLVVLSAKRLPQLPDVPTMVELGYPQVEAYAWQGLVVPVNTPADIRQKLSQEMQLAVNNPAVRKKLVDASWEPVPGDAVQMQAYMAAETTKWHKLIRARRISLD